MSGLHASLMALLWASWAGYWSATAIGVKRAERRESLASRAAHIVPLALAVGLLAVRRTTLPLLDARFLPASGAAFWVGAAITLAGLLFAVQARRWLGRNWSGTVTLKHGHELVTGGPYRLVRHPIYTGLLMAVVGSAIALGEWRGLVAVALVWLSFARKMRLEERWMHERFGEAYAQYRRRVPALVPGLRR